MQYAEDMMVDEGIGVEVGDMPADRPIEETPPEDRRKLVARITREIMSDRKHHAKAYERMRRDMGYAMHGHGDMWDEKLYKANLCGRHVKQKTAALYAKNPKAVARRRETMDFAVWDENPQSLMLAQQTIMQAQMLMAQAQQAGIVPTPDMVPPEMMMAFEQAMRTVRDFTEGTQRRDTIKKVAKTLEILFAYFMNEQKPRNFKQAMKAVVRRTCTTGVGYVKLGFQREMGPRVAREAQLEDMKARLDRIETLLAEAGEENNFYEQDAEAEEIRLAIQALQAEPDIILREGLVLDFPQSTRVIPDRMCQELAGFVGARHVTIQHMYTRDEVRDTFGVDLKKYNGYSQSGEPLKGERQMDIFEDDPVTLSDEKAEGLVCVWEHYDKRTGLLYYIADGYDDFLREPTSPDVYVENFWPIFALTFNAVEHEKELFPPSDVALIKDMQDEYNNSRQGQREHRRAARPKWAYANGALGEQDALNLATLKPLEAVGLNMDPQQKIADVLQPIPIPGVDPNLYETSQFFTDMQLTVGTQQAMMGGLSKATATESSIAASSTASSEGASIDELDSFLSDIARASSQILLTEMSAEQVTEIVGPGAVWPEMTLPEIAKELFLEVEAGSTGKPNQAAEINNWERLLPFLLQMGSIEPMWLAKETLRRLDDRMDLTEAVTAGIPSIVAQNGMAQLAPPDAADDPQAQGPQGAANAPAAPGGPTGSDAAFGSNQV